jgi:hypothetical protein
MRNMPAANPPLPEPQAEALKAFGVALVSGARA